MPDLHSGRTSEDIGCLAHEPSRVDLSACGDDLGFSETLLLGGRRERGGDFSREDDVFDEDAFDCDTPFVGYVADDFGYLEGDGFTLGDDGLDGASTDDVTEGGLCSL